MLGFLEHSENKCFKVKKSLVKTVINLFNCSFCFGSGIGKTEESKCVFPLIIKKKIALGYHRKWVIIYNSVNNKNPIWYVFGAFSSITFV